MLEEQQIIACAPSQTRLGFADSKVANQGEKDIVAYLFAFLVEAVRNTAAVDQQQANPVKVLLVFLVAQTTHTFSLPSLGSVIFSADARNFFSPIENLGIPQAADSSTNLIERFEANAAQISNANAHKIVTQLKQQTR